MTYTFLFHAGPQAEGAARRPRVRQSPLRLFPAAQLRLVQPSLNVLGPARPLHPLPPVQGGGSGPRGSGKRLLPRDVAFVSLRIKNVFVNLHLSWRPDQSAQDVVHRDQEDDQYDDPAAGNAHLRQTVTVPDEHHNFGSSGLLPLRRRADPKVSGPSRCSQPSISSSASDRKESSGVQDWRSSTPSNRSPGDGGTDEGLTRALNWPSRTLRRERPLAYPDSRVWPTSPPLARMRSSGRGRSSAGSTIGARLQTGHNVVIREENCRQFPLLEQRRH